MLALDAPCQRKCAQLHPVAIEKLPAACCGEQRHLTTPSPGLAVEEQDSFPHPYPEQATPTVWFPEMIAVLVRASSKNPRCGKWPLAGQELLVLVLWRRLSPRGASSTSPCAKYQSAMQLHLGAEMASSGELLPTEGGLQKMLSWPSFNAGSCFTREMVPTLLCSTSSASLKV